MGFGRDLRRGAGKVAKYIKKKTKAPTAAELEMQIKREKLLLERETLKAKRRKLGGGTGASAFLQETGTLAGKLQEGINVGVVGMEPKRKRRRR